MTLCQLSSTSRKGSAMTTHPRDLLPAPDAHPHSRPDNDPPRGVLRAPERYPELGALPAARPVGASLSEGDQDRRRMPALLAGGYVPPRPPRTGLWGVSAFALIALLCGYGLWFEEEAVNVKETHSRQGPVDMPASPQSKAAQAAAKPAEVVIEAVIVPSEMLPVRVREQFAQAAAAAKSVPEPPQEKMAEQQPPAMPDQKPDLEPVPIAQAADAPYVAESNEPALVPVIPPETADTPQVTDAPLPPHKGQTRDGIAMAAFTIKGSGSPEIIESWLASGLAELHLKSAAGTFSVTFGNRGYRDPATVVRTPVVAGAQDFMITYAAPIPPGIPRAALNIQLAQLIGSRAEIETVDLVLKPPVVAALQAAQARVVTALETAGQMPPEGVDALRVTACLDHATGAARIAAVMLAKGSTPLPVPSECN